MVLSHYLYESHAFCLVPLPESIDEDGDIATYHWEQVAGPSLSNGSSAETPILLLHNLPPGQYSFK